MEKSNFKLSANEYLNSCDSRDIVSFSSKDPIYIHKIFSLILSALDYNLSNIIANLIVQKLERKCDAKLWFKDGEKCEILRADSTGWQIGKMKLKINFTLEFTPDKPEFKASPLDDVRQEIEQDNS